MVSDNGLLPVRPQAITSLNNDLLLVGPCKQILQTLAKSDILKIYSYIWSY